MIHAWTGSNQPWNKIITITELRAKGILEKIGLGRRIWASIGIKPVSIRDGMLGRSPSRPKVPIPPGKDPWIWETLWMYMYHECNIYDIMAQFRLVSSFVQWPFSTLQRKKNKRSWSPQTAIKKKRHMLNCWQETSNSTQVQIWLHHAFSITIHRGFDLIHKNFPQAEKFNLKMFEVIAT